MKKQFVFLALALLLCMASACGAKPEASAASPEASTTQPEVSVTKPEPPAMEAGYPYGNMQKDAPAGNFMRHGDQVIFLDVQNGLPNLYTYDLADGTVSLFCKDATKAGTLRLWGNLESYEGELYALTSSHQVARLRDDSPEPILEGSLSSFWHSRGKLYICTSDASLLVYEDGKSRTLLEEYTGRGSVVYGQYLYFLSGDSIYRVDLQSETPQPEVVVSQAEGMVEGNHIYYADSKTFFLYRCNLDGSAPELLLDKPVLPASLNFDDAYIYFRLYTDAALDTGEDCRDLYRLSKKDPTQPKKIAQLPLPVFTVYTLPDCDRLFVKTLGPLEPNGNRSSFPLYVLDSDGSSLALLELPEF